MAEQHHDYYQGPPTSYDAGEQPLWLDAGARAHGQGQLGSSIESALQDQWQHSQPHTASFRAQPFSSDPRADGDAQQLYPSYEHEYAAPIAFPSSFPPGPYLQHPQPMPLAQPKPVGSLIPGEEVPQPASLQTTPTANNAETTPQQAQRSRFVNAFVSPTKKTRAHPSPRKSRRKPPAERSTSVQPLSPSKTRPRLPQTISSNPLSPSSSASTTSITRPTTPSSRQAHLPVKGPSSPSKAHQRYTPYKQFDNDAHPPLSIPMPLPQHSKVLAYEQHLPEACPMLTPPSDPSARSYHSLAPEAGEAAGALSYAHLPPSGSITAPYGLYTPEFYPMSEMGLAGHHESYDGGDVYGAAGYAPQPGYGVSGGQPVPGAFHVSAMHSITETSELLGHPLTKYTRNLYANLAEASRFHLAQTATKARKSRAKGAAAPTAEADASALHLASAPPAQQPPHSTDNSSPLSVESEDEELAVGRKTDEEGGEANDEEELGQFGGNDGEDDFSENLDDCFPWVYKMVMNQQVATNPDGSLRIPRSSNSYMIFRAWTGRQKVRDNLVLDEETKKSVIELLEGKNAIARQRLHEASNDKGKKTWQNAIEQNDKRINNIKINESNGMPQSCVSVVTSVLWSKTDMETKKVFADLAKYAAELHVQRFPGYKYQPEKKEAKKARLEAMRLAKKAAKEHAKAEAARIKYASAARKPKKGKKGKNAVDPQVEADPLPEAGDEAGPANAFWETRDPHMMDGEHSAHTFFTENLDPGTGVRAHRGPYVSLLPMELQQHPHIRMMQEQQMPLPFHPALEEGQHTITQRSIVEATSWQSAWQDPSYRRDGYQTIEMPLHLPTDEQADAASAQNLAGHVELRLSSRPPDHEGSIMDAVLVPAQYGGVAHGQPGDQAYPVDLMGISQDDLAQLDLWGLIEADTNAEILAGLPAGGGGTFANGGDADYAELVVNDWAELVDTTEGADSGGYVDYEVSTGLADRILANYASEYGHLAHMAEQPFDGAQAAWSGGGHRFAGINNHAQAQDTLLPAANPITPLDGAFPDVFQRSLAAQQVNSFGHSTLGLGGESGMHSYGASPHVISPTYSTFGELSHRYISSSAYPLMSGNPMDDYGDAGSRQASTATQQPRVISEMFDPGDMPSGPMPERMPAPALEAADSGSVPTGGGRTSVVTRRGRRARVLGQTHR